MKKIFKTSDIRNLEQQVASGEISYSRMVEIMNEMANKGFENKLPLVHCNYCLDTKIKEDGGHCYECEEKDVLVFHKYIDKPCNCINPMPDTGKNYCTRCCKKLAKFY